MYECKAEWLEGRNIGCEATESTLNKVRGEVEEVISNRDTLNSECARLQAKVNELEAAIKEKSDALSKLSDYLRNDVAVYRHNLAALTRDFSVLSGTYPLVIPGGAGDFEIKSGAFDFNLCLRFYRSAPLSTYISFVLQQGFSLAIRGDMALDLTNAVSIGMFGVTPSIVANTDENCPFSELASAIENAPTQVVLVEGVLGSERDIKVLSLLRHVKGKTLIFALDEFQNLPLISSVVFHYVAYVEPTPVQEKSSSPYYRPASPIVIPTSRTNTFPVWPAGDAKTTEVKEYIARQRKLMGES